MRRALVAVVLGLSAPAAACFSPSFERCAVECAGGDCPPGTHCLADGRCHADPDEALCVVGDDIDAGDEIPVTDAALPDAAPFDAGMAVIPTETGQLVISEIFKDPTQDLEENLREWFEIHNPTDLRFELMGLKVRDDGTDIFDVDESVVLAPHGRVVFARNGDIEVNGGVDADFDYEDVDEMFALGNGSDVVEIIYPVNDVVLDRVAYGSTADGWPDEEGASVSLDPAEHDDLSNDLPESWCDASRTPGLPNPDC